MKNIIEQSYDNKQRGKASVEPGLSELELYKFFNNYKNPTREFGCDATQDGFWEMMAGTADVGLTFEK